MFIDEVMYSRANNEQMRCELVLIVFLRALLLYTIVVVVMRLMGKREIGQLQPFELVIAIMIAELAAVPMESTEVPLMNGIIPIVTLLIAHLGFSYVNLKSERIRGIVCGKPSVLIEGGKLVESELRRQRYNLNDLMEQLRAKNFPNIADVEFAILETSGQVSVIPKSQKRPVVPEDLKIDTKYEGLPVNLVIDGHVLGQNLHAINLDEKWLQSELKKLGISSPGELLFASIDTTGEIYYQKKEENK